MKISAITIKNYRSIRETVIHPGQFCVLVGQNNHGKTNVFEAIQWFYNSKSTEIDEHHQKISENTVSVQIDFCDVIDSDIDRLASDGTKTKIRSLLGSSNRFSIVKTSLTHKRSYIVDGVDKGNPTGIDTAINEFIPRLEYVTTHIKLDDYARYKEKNPIGTMLTGVLMSVIENSKEYHDFRTQFERLFDNEGSGVRTELNRLGKDVEVHLRKQFPDGTSIRFTVAPPVFSELLRTFETIVDDGIETSAAAKGDGMQRAVMLAVIQAFAQYRRAQPGGASFVFLIDEAELHLHPTAQRSLKEALLELSTSDQIMINTHSSVMVAEVDDRQTIYRVEKTSGITDVRRIEEAERPDIIFELLGGSPADLLLPRNFLVVEGRSEFVFITEVVKRFFKNEFSGIKILFAGGDLVEQERSIHSVHKALVPLISPDKPIYRDKLVVLIDKPNSTQQAHYSEFLSSYPYLKSSGRIFELPFCSLEESYPERFRRMPAETKAQGFSKVKYAQAVAQDITIEELINDMPDITAAIRAAIDHAFK